MNKKPLDKFEDYIKEKFGIEKTDNKAIARCILDHLKKLALISEVYAAHDKDKGHENKELQKAIEFNELFIEVLEDELN